jgi:hypothetical protein
LAILTQRNTEKSLLGEGRVLLQRVQDGQGALVPHLAPAELQGSQVPILHSRREALMSPPPPPRRAFLNLLQPSLSAASETAWAPRRASLTLFDPPPPLSPRAAVGNPMFSIYQPNTALRCASLNLSTLCPSTLAPTAAAEIVWAGARTKPGGRPCLGQDGGEVDGHLIAQRVLAQRQLRQAAERAQVTMMLARGRFSIDWNKGKTSIHRQDKQSALSGKQVPVSRR